MKTSSSGHRVEPTSRDNLKKVQFDSARVCFQVEYDVPDDKSLRARLPLWTEHWKKSKKSLLLQLFRSVTCHHWLRLLVRVTCLFLFFFHTSLLTRHLPKNNLSSLVTHDTPTRFPAPALSLCFPFTPPLVTCLNGSALCPQLSLRAIFNHSLSFHPLLRCKRDLKTGEQSDCSAPLRWINGDRKCFTFRTEVDDMWTRDRKLSLFVHKSHPLHVFVHRQHVLPVGRVTRALEVARESAKDVEIAFFVTRVSSHHNCSPRDSHTDCLFQCAQHAMHAHCQCVSRLAFIRETDVLARDASFCLGTTDNSPCNNATLFSRLVLDTCHARCPEDCQKSDFHLELSESDSRDVSETNITIRRSLTPDLTIKHVTRITCSEFWALIGGLMALYLLIAFILCKFLELIRILWELIEIYCF